MAIDGHCPPARAFGSSRSSSGFRIPVILGLREVDLHCEATGLVPEGADEDWPVSFRAMPPYKEVEASVRARAHAFRRVRELDNLARVA